jgi:hypothetical protein
MPVLPACVTASDPYENKIVVGVPYIQGSSSVGQQESTPTHSDMEMVFQCVHE